MFILMLSLPSIANFSSRPVIKIQMGGLKYLLDNSKISPIRISS